MKYLSLIKEICEEENINFNLISAGWVMSLTKNNLTKCISGYKFPLNNHALGEVLDDKYALYDLCHNLNIPIIKHKIIFNPNSNLGKNTPSYLKECFNEYNKDIVIKPNNGTEGNDIYHLTNLEDLKHYSDKLFQNNFSISICPYYNIESEYRVVVLDNEVELVYEKCKPVVVGDGIHTIKDLLINLNKEYFSKINFDKSYERTLPLNETFEYDWRFNLSKGATARLVSDKILLGKLTNFAINTSKKIGVRFVSVDIVKVNNDLLLMEINSGVCINKVTNFLDKDLHITKRIYKKAIQKMFE